MIALEILHRCIFTTRRRYPFAWLDLTWFSWFQWRSKVFLAKCVGTRHETMKRFRFAFNANGSMKESKKVSTKNTVIIILFQRWHHFCREKLFRLHFFATATQRKSHPRMRSREVYVVAHGLRFDCLLSFFVCLCVRLSVRIVCLTFRCLLPPPHRQKQTYFHIIFTKKRTKPKMFSVNWTSNLCLCVFFLFLCCSNRFPFFPWLSYHTLPLIRVLVMVSQTNQNVPQHSISDTHIPRVQ